MESNPSIPRLKGRENYAIWKLVIKAAVEAESFVTNRRAGYLESKTKQFILSSVSEKILYSISQCEDSQTMFDKLETLYGNRKEDLDNLHTQFQTFVYDEKQSVQENVNRLENIRQQITSLEDNISDSAFRSRLVNSLPKGFESIKSASNLNKTLELDDLVAGLILEENQHHIADSLKEEEETVQKMNSVALVCCCEHSGQKQNSKSEMNSATSTLCKYCKEAGHLVSNCPKLERRRNVSCYKCGEKGHFAKNCQEKGNSNSGSSSAFLAC